MNASRLSLVLKVMAASILVAAVFPARADEAQEISRMLKQGQQEKALDRANNYLVSHPKDAQVRFVKGLILTEQNKTAEAIKVFTSITDDYPELPEPYNNLAVLYASQGQYEKARTALEMAISTHPTYATAHENLGDIYAKMASQSYDKALQLDKGNANAQSKLALVKEIFSKQAGMAPKKSAVAEKSSSAPGVAVPTTSPVATSVAASKSMSQTESAKPVVAQPEPATAKMTNAAKAAEGEAAVRSAVEAWADAWSRKDVSAYLKAYAPDFVPPKGASRKAWEQERRERIGKPKSIQVKLNEVHVSFQDDSRAKVTFRQMYRASSLDSDTWKTLKMVRSGGVWLIHEERIGK